MDQDDTQSVSPAEYESLSQSLDNIEALNSDDIPETPHAPPAHIAARFARRSVTRRKSSATSSRRNSLSSSHSHGSSRSLRRASTQSHYIAQQLRRSSILEDRKARLADRAAHCEQVRLRAALAKAAPRGNSTSSEERAMAAQLARAKYLAKVTAQCAEEVQKAKAKAQEMKARKSEEERKARQDMEDRLAEADKRRAEHQRNLHARRTRRSSSQEKKLAPVAEDANVTELPQQTRLLLDQDTAARRIQQAWQTHKRRKVVIAWLDQSISVDTLRQKTSDEASATIMSETLINTTRKLLHLFGLVSANESARRYATRALLSAYLILARPTEIMGKLGGLENDLLGKAQEFIVVFEAAICRLSQWNRYTPSVARQQELQQAYATFIAAFEAWKTSDSSSLVSTMVASFVELDAIWQSVKDDPFGNVAADYKQGIRDNQVILLSQIRKLAGPDRADVLIKQAIRESRRRRGRKPTRAEVRPRVAEEGTDGQVQQVDFQQTNNPPAMAESESQSFAALFSPIPPNRILTHELAVSKDYRIPAGKNAELRNQFNRKLCDSMQEGIEQGQAAIWTTAMAQCIRGKLLGLVKQPHPLHSPISEALDPDHIHRQSSQGLFSYSKFFEFMASILPNICAPFRDTQVKDLAEDLRNSTEGTAEMIEKLFRLLHFIDLMSLDYSNYLLMGVAPALIREAAGYEQRMFAADLERGDTVLSNTRRWIRNATVNALTEADGRDPERIRLLVDRPTTVKIHVRGVVDMVCASENTYLDSWPETLALDKARITSLRCDFFKIVCLGGSLLMAKNLLKRDVRAPWKNEASRLWDILGKEDGLRTENVGLQLSTALLTSKNMPAGSETYLQTAITRYCQQCAAGRLTDPVLKLLANRLKTHIYLRLSVSSSQDRVRAVSNAGSALTSAGLPEFISHVSDLVDHLSRLADVDFKAHEPWYKQIVQEIQDAGDA